MKWLFFTTYFPPEIGSASFLFYELGGNLIKKGHEVTLITGFPKYNVDVKDLPEKYRNKLYLQEKMNGINVKRIKTVGLPRYVPIARGIDQFITAFIFFVGGLFTREKYDRILVYSPPLPLGLTAYALSRIKKVPFIFNLQDIFPQSAIDLGILKNKLLINIFRKMETFIYRKAFRVATHSEGNRQYVISKGVPEERVCIVHNWIDTEAIKPETKNNSFRQELGIKNEFVISFAGVIGYSQDLDVAIDSIQYLKDCQDIVFVFVGNGVEKPRLEKKVKDLGYDNVKFVPMQPKEKYPSILHASDLCLVTLRENVKTPVVPSKLISIMAAGRPVLGSMNMDGDAPKIIEDAKCGICIEAENPKKFAESIRKIYKNSQLANEYGQNARKYAVENFSIDKCTKMYEI